MNAEHKKLADLFLELRGRVPAARAARLDEIRRTSPPLAAEVESLLRHDSDPPEILRSGAVAGRRADVPPERIGPYRILSTLGEGGMGAVLLAEQDAPLRRRVAIKIIRSGVGSASARIRFEIERQMLARLNHSNVARVFEAGTTETGQPYFTMELVNGPCITEYCDRRKLSLRGRLELFLQVCAGVHHAHQRGILHRDLKPGNVLIEDDGDRATPKVIDFGVAKALDPTPEAAGGARTRQGQLLGTPPYMSPEQVTASERGVDVRSDVYSLGAILYELLCGAPPLDLEGIDPLDIAGIRRRVRHAAPLAPSRRVGSQPASVAACRASRPERLRRTLAGDLDGVVLKALQRDPVDRYESVPELADDIRRYLSHEPVRAAPQGWVSRLRKRVRRNRVGASFVALLVLVSVVTSVLAWRLALARTQAESALRNAEDYVGLLLHGYELAGPSSLRSGPTSPSRLLDRAAENVEWLSQHPEAGPGLLRGIGDAHVRAGRLEEGRAILDLAGNAASRAGPDSELRALEVQASRGFLASLEAHWSEAETALRDVIARSGTLGPAAAQVRTEARRDLVRLLRTTGRGKESLGEMEQLVEQLSADLGAQNPETLIAEAYLGSIELSERSYHRAAARLEDLIPRLESALGPRHQEVLIATYNLACCLANLGEAERAIQMLDLAVDRGLTIGPTVVADPDLAPLRGDPRLREIVERYEMNQAAADNSLGNLFPLYVRFGDVQGAARLARSLLEANERVFGPDDPATLRARYDVAAGDMFTGRYVEAEAAWLRLLAVYHPDPTVAPSDPGLVGSIHAAIAQCRLGLGHREEALRSLERALDFYSKEPVVYAAAAAYARAGRLLLLGDRAGALREVRTALQLSPMSQYSPERDVLFRELRDDPEFRALLAAERSALCCVY